MGSEIRGADMKSADIHPRDDAQSLQFSDVDIILLGKDLRFRELSAKCTSSLE